MQKLIIALIGAICFHLPLSASALTGSLITTVAGTTKGFSGDGMAATVAQLDVPAGVAIDAAGNLFIADRDNHRIRKVDSTTGLISTVAGTGVDGFSGDGMLATAAQLDEPQDVAVDAAGNLFIADQTNNRIRKVDGTTGIISTVAGMGLDGFSGDGGPATAAQLARPQSVVLDAAGNLFIADRFNNTIRKVDGTTGIISTVAGTGPPGSSGDGGLATAARLSFPFGIAVDATGNLFVADSNNDRIRKVDSTTGIISTVAGTGGGGFSGDGGAATAAQLDFPTSIDVDAAGNLFFIDRTNNRIRKVDGTTGLISTAAGTGAFGLSSDGGPATAAKLFSPQGIAFDAAGNLFIADSSNQRIRKVEVPEPGDIHTVAGTGTSGFSGDGAAATAAQLSLPSGVAIDAAGNLFIADSNNHRIRKLDSTTGVISTVAGTGMSGFSDDGGLATAAQLFFPDGVAVDAVGNLFIADVSNHRIRKVDSTTGVISTVAGTGMSGFNGDGDSALTQLDSPTSVAVDAAGNLFIADVSNHRIRKVDSTTGVISTVAGTGMPGFSGDGGAATAAQLDGPQHVAVDAAGNLFIADVSNHRIRKVDGVTGVITTVAGTGVEGFSGDGVAATTAQFAFPNSIDVDAAGNLFIADFANNRIRKVDSTTGVISTVAGTGAFGFSGDGGAATAAQLSFPGSVAVDAAGNLFIADRNNHRIRKVEAPAPTGTGKIGDFVWEDSNGNGRQDNGEPGLDGVTVKLRLDCNSATTQSMITSNGGAFLFDGLPAGQYQLEFVLPTGYSFSPRIAAGDYTIDSNPDAAGLDTCRPLADGQQRPGLDAGLIPSGGAMDTLMLLKAIYYPNDNRIWIKAVSDALPASAVITATGITNGVETVLGQVGWKADKMAYQQVFKNLASVPDTIRLNSHLGGMVTASVQGGGGGSSADTLTVLKAIYYTADNRLWIKASSDASPAGSAVITANNVINGVEMMLGQVIWKPSKNAYQTVFKNIAQPDSIILNSNLGGTVAASIEVRQ